MRRATGRLVVPVAAAAAVSLIVAGASVSGLVGQRHNSFSVSVDPPSDTSLALHARANEVFEAFNGTVRQRDASGVLQAWSLNGAMDKCMEDAGFPQWDWSATRNAAPRTNALGTSVFFSEPMVHAYSNALMDIVESSRAEERLRTSVLTPDEDAAVGKCLEATPVTSDEAATSYSTPEVAAALRSHWWVMVDSFDSKYGDMSAYTSCFGRGDRELEVDLGVTGDSWQQVLAELAPPPSKTPPDAASQLTTAPAWSSFTQTEALVESIDWTCRAAIYEAHLDEVESAVDQFLADHADEIAQAQAEWLKVEQRATELGFYGQDGSID